ncbi:MAG: hypothetical protein ACFFE8_09515 [Candidatus Heimdallarchaeota archaeon]
MSGNEDSLKRYKCAQCGRSPTSEWEIFKGCECGHRLFRIVPRNKPLLIPGRPYQLTNNQGVPEFLTVKEEREGVYEINVNQLLQNNEEMQTPLVVGTEGVFVIKGLAPKRKSEI